MDKNTQLRHMTQKVSLINMLTRSNMTIDPELIRENTQIILRQYVILVIDSSESMNMFYRQKEEATSTQEAQITRLDLIKNEFANILNDDNSSQAWYIYQFGSTFDTVYQPTDDEIQIGLWKVHALQELKQIRAGGNMSMDKVVLSLNQKIQSLYQNNGIQSNSKLQIYFLTDNEESFEHLDAKISTQNRETFLKFNQIKRFIRIWDCMSDTSPQITEQTQQSLGFDPKHDIVFKSLQELIDQTKHIFKLLNSGQRLCEMDDVMVCIESSNFLSQKRDSYIEDVQKKSAYFSQIDQSLIQIEDQSSALDKSSSQVRQEEQVKLAYETMEGFDNDAQKMIQQIDEVLKSDYQNSEQLIYNISSLVRSSIECERVMKQFQDEFQFLQDDFADDEINLNLLEDYIVDIERKFNLIEQKTSQNRKHEAFQAYLSFTEAKVKYLSAFSGPCQNLQVKIGKFGEKMKRNSIEEKPILEQMDEISENNIRVFKLYTENLYNFFCQMDQLISLYGIEQDQYMAQKQKIYEPSIPNLKLGLLQIFKGEKDIHNQDIQKITAIHEKIKEKYFSDVANKK